ncbi:NfeD family protein [Edaphobacter bradus]|uniref:NfeD family protein n=1 Tax=Edaphobacter bradus TaxID=2259016 RepID=UPI0021DF9375|nr:nodulation protein NfeD [Edaphobacter bradus]
MNWPAIHRNTAGSSVRQLVSLLSLLCCIGVFAQTQPANQPVVLKLTLHDTIQPVTAGYLSRGLAEASRRHASAVLVSLGTPGGLLDSTRLMVQTIENSPIPVIFYVSPSGSRAASAGFFLLESADVAAMAPGTNAGAAHPIIEGGEKIDPALKEKIENDAEAFLRSYASRRNRNLDAAIDAVRNSKSYSDDEALKLNLIDLTAPDDATLLNTLDNRTIHRFNGATETLHLRDATIVTFAPSLRERLLGRLTNPDLAVLLLVLGGLLIYLEFNVPGTIVPGSLGTLLVLLGLFGLNLLPVRHTAVALLFAAFILIVLEAKFASHGALGLAGVISLVFGLATLVDAPIPELRVHTAVALAAGLGFGIITLCLAWIAVRARRSKILTGPQAMVGATAIIRSPLSLAGHDSGQVEIRGELWQARLLNPTPNDLPVGSEVRVSSVDGLTLLVEPSPSFPSARPSGKVD